MNVKWPQKYSIPKYIYKNERTIYESSDQFHFPEIGLQNKNDSGFKVLKDKY